MPKMKDSGFEWIGEIPADWKLLKGKYLFAQRNDRGNSISLQLLSPTQKFGVIPQSLYEELTTNVAVKLKEGANLAEFKTIHKGDYCISLRSFQGGFEYSEYEGVVSPAYQVFYPVVQLSTGYYKYLFKEESFIRKMNSYTLSLRDGKNIAFSDFGNTEIPVPPFEVQQSIAVFLDSKCSEIDLLLADIQLEISTLEEYKRSLITETVTKGLNKSVSMKNSDVQWIGMIPEHWEISRFRYLLVERNIKNTNLLTEERLSLSIDKGVTLYADKTTNLDRFKEDCTQYKVVYPNDLVLNSMNMIVGASGKSKYMGCVSPAYYIFYCTRNDVNIDYYTYIFQSVYLKDHLHKLGKGIMAIERGDGRINTCRLRVSSDDLKNIFFPLPPKKEQDEIVLFLSEKIKTIEEIIELKKKQQVTLEEYKKAVIYEYVTGKKEVPAV